MITKNKYDIITIESRNNMSKNEELSNEILNKYPLTQTRCNEIIKYYPKLVAKIPIEFITIDMCIYLIKTDPLLIDYIPKGMTFNQEDKDRLELFMYACIQIIGIYSEERIQERREQKNKSLIKDTKNR